MPELVREYPDWSASARAHSSAVDALTSGHQARALSGVKHPVIDFLFTYYHNTVGKLRRWHPGAGVSLRGRAHQAKWTHYITDGDLTHLDVNSWRAARGRQAATTLKVLVATAGRRPSFGCYGLHEWAMVYRMSPDQIRHADWPLRLGQDGTDDVVESHRIACTHFDAFRFFTDDAQPLNAVQLTRDSQEQHEQPACLHAGMDLYKAAFHNAEIVGSDLMLRCFRHAMLAREIDMRASPYDLSDLGYRPIAIETPQGKAEYITHQRELAHSASPLRTELITKISAVLEQ